MTLPDCLPLIITEWDKSKRDGVRVTLDEYRGQPTIDIRVFYETGEGVRRPSPKGITLGVRHLSSLAEATAQAEVKARELDLI